MGDTIDLVLLDIMLPKIDGYGVCEVIRRRSQVPIIMLTALSDEENQLRGFEQQIDDYIPKPFDMPVLLCKIAAVLRRTGKTEQKKDLIYGGLKLDEEGHHLFNEGQEVELTQKEFDLLRLFLRTPAGFLPGRISWIRFGARTISGTSGSWTPTSRTFGKKLGNQLIETVRGVGYRLERLKK